MRVLSLILLNGHERLSIAHLFVRMCWARPSMPVDSRLELETSYS